MSDIIEERLKEVYCNMNIEIEKNQAELGKYEVRILIDWNKGFKMDFKWNEKLTYDKNIEVLISNIDELIVKYFKKVRA